MQDLRIVLVIVGALAIAALIIHGLWTNQKNKRAQIKNNPPKSAGKRSEPRDGEGFDSDGVGQVRIVKNNNKPRDSEPVISAVPQFSAQEDEETLPSMATVETDEPILDEHFSEPSEPSVPRGDWKDVYVINIAAREGAYIYGRELKHALRILGFRFGEMDIYHRHLEMDGQGEILFSLINTVKPGTFDPSKMDRLMTPGISLFMQLPKQGRAVAHFDLMLKAADKLASEVDGILLDGQRRPLSEYYLAQCRDELKDYDQA